jgi:hypothetical protein
MAWSEPTPISDEQHMTKSPRTGRDPTEKELREAERVMQLHPLQQKAHPSAVAADQSKLSHINTYGALPDFYIDKVFACRKCGKREIWKASSQKWYYEEAKGHIDATAVECHECRRREGILTPVANGNYELRFFGEDVERECVAAFAIFRGTHTDPGGPVEPTGQSVAADYVYAMEFEGGLIRHMTKIWNDVISLQQLGWA